MKAFIYLILTALVLTACQSPPKKEPIDDLVTQIEEKLPEGWSVVWEPEYSSLEVLRNEKVEAYFTPPNTAIDEKSETSRYRFAFRLRDKVSESEYQQLSSRNQEINKEQAVLYDQLIARRVDHKFDSFIPNNDEDRALVTLYDNLKAKENSLPHYHFRDRSLTWIYGGPDSESHTIADEKIRIECHTVRADVISILTSYADH